MALLPARRGGTLTRPGSQAEGRWDPFAEFEGLYQQMGRLMDSAFGGMWQPLAQAWAPLADLSETMADTGQVVVFRILKGIHFIRCRLRLGICHDVEEQVSPYTLLVRPYGEMLQWPEHPHRVDILDIGQRIKQRPEDGLHALGNEIVEQVYHQEDVARSLRAGLPMKLVSGAAQYRPGLAQHVIGRLDPGLQTATDRVDPACPVPVDAAVVLTKRTWHGLNLEGHRRRAIREDRRWFHPVTGPTGQVEPQVSPTLRIDTRRGVRRNVVVSSAAKCSPARTFSFFSVSGPSVSTI
jgi:hypothetical protein